MPALARASQSRTPGAPAYYLGRPATWWLATLHPPRQRRPRPAAAGLAKAANLNDAPLQMDNRPGGELVCRKGQDGYSWSICAPGAECPGAMSGQMTWPQTTAT